VKYVTESTLPGLTALNGTWRHTEIAGVIALGEGLRWLASIDWTGSASTS